MGVPNFLVEGVSGTGKTSVCAELVRRGYHSINGDEELAYQGDLETLHQRLDQRPADEWGSKPAERDLIVHLHETMEAVPGSGVVIDATPPLGEVVDEILRHVRRSSHSGST